MLILLFRFCKNLQAITLINQKVNSLPKDKGPRLEDGHVLGVPAPLWDIAM